MAMVLRADGGLCGRVELPRSVRISKKCVMPLQSKVPQASRLYVGPSATMGGRGRDFGAPGGGRAREFGRDFGVGGGGARPGGRNGPSSPLSFGMRQPVIGVGDYKNVSLLRRFVTKRGKILSRKMSGLSAKQQRAMTAAVKQARILALLPFVITEY